MPLGQSLRFLSLGGREGVFPCLEQQSPALLVSGVNHLSVAQSLAPELFEDAHIVLVLGYGGWHGEIVGLVQHALCPANEQVAGIVYRVEKLLQGLL